MRFQRLGPDEDPLLRLMLAQAHADERVLPWQAKIRRGDCYITYAPGLRAIIYGEVLGTEGGNIRSVRAFSQFCRNGEHGGLHVSDIDGLLSREQFQMAKAMDWPSTPEEFAAVVAGDKRFGEQFPLPWERAKEWSDRKDAEELAEEEGAALSWEPFPPEAAAYREFMEDVLQRASSPDVTNGRLLRITNGVIDWSGYEERRCARREFDKGDNGGWIDPSYTDLGSCSRQFIPAEVLQEEPFHVTWNRRGVSLVSLQTPNWIPRDDSRSFYSRVITPLLDLPSDHDDLFGWLRVFFAFAKRKPVAYVSRYEPSARIHELAQEQGVTVVYFPLERIPPRRLDENGAFRFLNVTENQYKTVLARLRDGRKTWVPERPDDRQR